MYSYFGDATLAKCGRPGQRQACLDLKSAINLWPQTALEQCGDMSTCRGSGVWTLFTRAGLVRPSLGVTPPNGPGHTSLGQPARRRAPAHTTPSLCPANVVASTPPCARANRY